MTLRAALVAAFLFGLCACASPETEHTTGIPADTASNAAASTTDTLVLQAGQSFAQRPAAPLRVEAACPFECCSYGTWTTTEETTVYARAHDTTAVAFTVSSGTTLDAATGHVLLTQVGAALARDSVRLYRDDSTYRTAAPGDTVYLLDYVGEGAYNAWYADSVYQVDGGMAFLEQPPGAPAPLAGLREPQSQWWVRVSTDDGRSGWLWMDRTPSVRGADACDG